MKTFKDLKFIPKKFDDGEIAKLNFANGYGISVITGPGSYSDEKNPYEVAVLYNETLCYDTPITNNVIGHLTEDKVSIIMKQIQDLKK